MTSTSVKTMAKPKKKPDDNNIKTAKYNFKLDVKI